MNKEDHFIDTDKLGDVLLEFSKKISRFSHNIPDTLFGSLTEFLKNIPDDVKNTQLFANVQKLSNYDLNYEDVWWLVDSYGLIDKEDLLWKNLCTLRMLCLKERTENEQENSRKTEGRVYDGEKTAA